VLRDHVTEQLGAIARPDDIRFANNLPKTRSGKIMRRLLRSIARNEDITQDLSTLENPSIIDQLRGEPSATTPVAEKRKPKSRPTPARKVKARPKVKLRPKAKSRPKVKARPVAKKAVRKKSKKKARAKK
jgi:hypothetical protein